MAALAELFSSQFYYSAAQDPPSAYSTTPKEQDPPSVYIEQKDSKETDMSGGSGNGFSESFTLISSTAESMGSAAAEHVNTRGFIGHINTGKDWISTKHSKVQPWADFFNPRNFSIPRGAGDVTSRLFGNLQRFQSNYLFVFLGLMVYCVITNPTLLFALAFCFGAWWFISVKKNSENITLFGRDTSAKELYLAVAVICVPLFYIAGAGSAVFWIIGASVVLILVHAALIAPPTSHKTIDEEMGLVLEEVTIS